MARRRFPTSTDKGWIAEKNDLHIYDKGWIAEKNDLHIYSMVVSIKSTAVSKGHYVLMLVQYCQIQDRWKDTFFLSGKVGMAVVLYLNNKCIVVI